MRTSANAMLLALAALCGLCTAAPAEEQCKLRRAAALDMTIDEAGGANIPITIGGQNFLMLIDTGGMYSLMKPSIAEKLNLELKTLPPEYRYAFMLYGKEFLNHHVEAKDIAIGHMPVMPHKDFVLLPENRLPPELAGTIAPDILRSFDIDFDFANEKFNLFLHDHCPQKVIYWADEGAYAVVPITLDSGWHADVPVELDGHRIKASLDTGSSRSLLSWEVAQRLFDLDEKSPGVKPDGKDFRYAFKALTMKGDNEGVTVTVQNPDIVLVPDKTSGMGNRDPVIILGMGILRQLHLYIAYEGKKLYVTPAGAHN